MKSYWLPILLAIFGMALAASAAMTRTVKVSDWCSMTTPTTCTLGGRVVVEVTLANVDRNLKAHVDLHYRDNNGVPMGMNSPGSETKSIPADGKLIFTLTVNEKAPMGSVYPVIYLSPTGEREDRVMEANGPNIIPDA